MSNIKYAKLILESYRSLEIDYFKARGILNNLEISFKRKQSLLIGLDSIAMEIEK